MTNIDKLLKILYNANRKYINNLVISTDVTHRKALNMLSVMDYDATLDEVNRKWSYMEYRLALGYRKQLDACSAAVQAVLAPEVEACYKEREQQLRADRVMDFMRDWDERVLLDMREARANRPRPVSASECPQKMARRERYRQTHWVRQDHGTRGTNRYPDAFDRFLDREVFRQHELFVRAEMLDELDDWVEELSTTPDTEDVDDFEQLRRELFEPQCVMDARDLYSLFHEIVEWRVAFRVCGIGVDEIECQFARLCGWIDFTAEGPDEVEWLMGILHEHGYFVAYEATRLAAMSCPSFMERSQAA